jgi:ATP-dependent 26S proteasome regulatory subunit
VDLAVQIPKPDTDERRRLLHLYARDVTLDLDAEPSLLAALDGVTASFVRELVRRAVSAQVDRTPDGTPITLTDDDLRDVLIELTAQHNTVTSRILGRD